MTFPLFSWAGASSCICCAIFWWRASHSFNCSIHWVNWGLLMFRQCFFSGINVCKATFNCTISRGEIRHTAILEANRSRSPMIRNSCSSSRRSVSCWMKLSTISNRWLISSGDFNGMQIQRRSIRLPMGVIVLSIISVNEQPPSWSDSNISRFRSVKRSNNTQVDSSIRPIEVICPTSSCLVMSK